MKWMIDEMRLGMERIDDTLKYWIFFRQNRMIMRSLFSMYDDSLV